MNNHKQLKEIMKKIWFVPRKYFWSTNTTKYHKQINFWTDCEVDVREIIFTQEFMDKFIKYTNNEDEEWEWFRYILLKNLDNLVPYLYNLTK